MHMCTLVGNVTNTLLSGDCRYRLNDDGAIEIENINSTTLTISYHSGYGGTCYYANVVVYCHEVPVDITGVELNKTSTTLTVGETDTLTATVNPNNSDHTVAWSSDNERVVTVSDGVVTAVAEGTATITVTATNGTDDKSDDKTATCAVTVNPITYTVTYSVVNGTWSDGTTADKTETVQRGSAPASVPTSMIAATGYTGGSWDKNPSEATITENTTFTYTFNAKTAATVTTAPAAKTLTYNGQAQELVTAGKAEGGEMQYALGTKDAATEKYTTSIPTKTEAGTYYVWYKAVGNDNYSDSDANCVTVKIAEKDDEISAKPEYKNTSGAGSTWTAGSTEVPTFTFKRTENDETTYDHCTGVMVDGKAVDSENYTKEKGSVIIKLKSAFLDTLSAGEHTLTAMFDDGDDVTVKFTIAAKAEEKKADVETKTTEAKTTEAKTADVETKTTEAKKTESPKTGDNSNIPLAFMLMLDSAMVAIYLTLRRREEK